MSIEMSIEMSINILIEMPIKNVNRNVNRNVNKNVNRNVSREPNFRYTTILLKKMKENDKKMSAENPILGTQRYF